MSFSSDVKTEICRGSLNRKCCAVAEAYGVVLYCHTFSPQSVKIVTEHGEFAARLPRLFRKAFGLSFDETVRTDSGTYVLRIRDREKITRIYETFDLDRQGGIMLHLNRGTLERECCEIAFARGAFLAGGSVTDPEKRYHLELVTTHRKIAGETYSLLLDLGFSPRDMERGGAAILYFKQSDQIEDFLTAIGAPVRAMELMEAKVEKEMRNAINRRCNCDEANATKVVDAAQTQLAAIRRLRETGRFGGLPAQIQETATMRERDPAASLTELAASLGVSKSAVNHRMRKILELAEQ